MVSSVSGGRQASSRYEAYQELVDISRENGTGNNITKAEFNKLQKGGLLDGWIKNHSYSFSDLDLNNSGRISSDFDGSRLRKASESIDGGSSGKQTSSKYDAHQDLIEISRENGTGSNVTEAEFNELQQGGFLDNWIKNHSYSFSDLDVNNSGRISSGSDGSKLREGAETSSESSSSGSSTSTKSSGDDDSSDRTSGDMVVVQFGWSDTSQSKTEDELEEAGISSSDYKMSDSGADKGVGIAVVTRDQAEEFKDLYSGSKTFVHIHDTVDGVDDINDLRVKFEVGSSKDSISFGGGDYGALMTDDPANKTSGSNVQGTQTRSDSFWSVSDGDKGSAKMYEESGAPNGKQFVKMSAEVR